MPSPRVDDADHLSHPPTQAIAALQLLIATGLPSGKTAMSPPPSRCLPDDDGASAPGGGAGGGRFRLDDASLDNSGTRYRPEEFPAIKHK